MLFVGDIDDGVCGPALTITLEWSEPGIDIDLIVTEPNGPGVSFYNSMGVSAPLDYARLRLVHLL